MPAPTRTSLLAGRQHLTTDIHVAPYDPNLYIRRARLYRKHGYPDLAVGDSYRVVLLGDAVREALDEEVIEPADLGTTLPEDFEHENEDFVTAANVVKYIPDEPTLLDLHNEALELLANSLEDVGCVRQAHGQRSILNPSTAATNGVDKEDLEAIGSARRVVYPWNTHEPDRFAPDVIDYINENIMPRCSNSLRVGVVDLPLLSPDSVEILGIMKHIGLFATKDIRVGDICMEEETALTAITDPVDGGLCDYCGQRWRKEIMPSRPTLNVILDKEGEQATSDDEETESEGDEEESEHPETWTCDLCEEAEAEGDLDDIIPPIWCSEHCKKAAMAKYHPAVCCRPIAGLYRGAIANQLPHTYTVRQPGGTAYSLLLLRTFAMALTQNKHPLELDETKYLYGVPPEPKDGIDIKINWTHEENVRDPVRILEALDIDTYTGKPRRRLHEDGAGIMVSNGEANGIGDGPNLDWWDTWVVNTLLAKFRGVASGRQDSRGRTEAAAAHTIYSMANHSCDPTVQWSCAGVTKFRAIAPRKNPDATIAVKEGEEVMSSYCNPELDYKERREWMVGVLGGYCMCERCLEEEKQDLEEKK